MSIFAGTADVAIIPRDFGSRYYVFRQFFLSYQVFVAAIAEYRTHRNVYLLIDPGVPVQPGFTKYEFLKTPTKWI